MRQFQVKVCGITRVADAALAARLGADMIGLIFYEKSPRYVTIAQAIQITGDLPPTVDRVGVFVAQSIVTILRTVERCRLDLVQVHSYYSASEIRQLQNSGVKVIQAFRVTERRDWRKLEGSHSDLKMLDNSEGKGISFETVPPPPKRATNFVLSGGVSAHNVAEGVTRFRPLVVDVNSSVESKPGIKSRGKLEAFFRRCNELRYGK